MKSVVFASVVLAATSRVFAVSEWGQCGGIGWIGSTTCDAGLTCIHVNDWHYQCQKGGITTASSSTAPGSTTKTSTTSAPTTSSTPPPTSGTEIPYGTLVTSCTVPNTVAITFDDGPYQYTSALIDSLNAAGVKATFFMCGLVYGCIYDYADVVKKAYSSGHQVASHTWDHAHLPTLSAADITTEMTRLETAFKKILGVRPKWVRPPYGEYNDAVLSTFKTLGYKAVTWNLDTQDWAGTPVNTSEALFTALGADPRVIPLEHDPIQTTAQQLGPWIAQWANARGLKAVTLSECLGEPVPAGQYVVTGGAGTKDSTWVCT